VGEAVRRSRGAIVAGLAALALPTLALLASVDRDGRRYAAAFRWSGVSAEPEAVESVAVRLWGYIVDGSLLAPRNIQLPPSQLDVILPLSLGLVAFGLARARRRREAAGWALALC
jgi:hypothetical protein